MLCPAMILVVAQTAVPLPKTCRNAPPLTDFYGQPVPVGKAVEVFAPGRISKAGRREGNVTFSSDGSEMYFTVVMKDKTLEVHRSVRMPLTTPLTGRWSVPRRVDGIHVGGYSTWEAFVTSDRQRLYFVSNRPPGSRPYNGRLWQATRRGQQWAAPHPLRLPISTKKGMWFPTEDCSGTVFFGSFPPDGHGKGDLLQARQTDVGWVVTNLGPILNSASEEWDPYVTPDGRFLLFASDRPGGVGGVDIYVSARRPDGKWGAPVNPGPPINTKGNDVAARLTPDGRFVFFDRPTPNGQDVYWARSDLVVSFAR